MLYEDSGLAFEYSYDSDACNSYLVLRLCNDPKLLIHQVEIICQNPNSAFVPFHIRRENENTCIYYNITSKISLPQYLERKKLNKKEFLDLLKGITRNLLQHGNYLLDLSSFVIHPDFIYINPATAEVSLLYVPITCSINAMEDYRAFLKDLVVNTANIDDNARDNYLQRILNYLKSDSFSLNDFNRLILDLRNSGGVNEYIERPLNEVAATGSSIPTARSSKSNVHDRAEGRRNTLRIALIQLLVILAASIACLIVMKHMKGDLVSIAGVLLIIAALDILIMKRVAGKANKNASVEDRNEVLAEVMGRSYNNEVGKPRHSYNKGIHRETALALDVFKACDTVIISEVPQDNHPYLESIGVHNGERIIINKNKFIIGRLGSMVDYIIQGSTVGKLHAEIKSAEGCYYIKDLNSKNGTYVNGVKITSNKEYEIKYNDKIRFSSYEYIFRQ